MSNNIYRIFFLILFFFYYGCESYNSRFFKKVDYNEKKSEYHYSDIRYYPIAGVKQKVKKIDFDKNDIIRKETFFRDNRVYRIRLYNESGKILKEDTYRDTNLNGSRILYYSNGNIKEKYNFNNLDVKVKKFTSYYHNGGLKSDIEYLDGALFGTCSWYYPSGNLMKIKDYLDETVYQIEYHENGSKKSEGSFDEDRLVGRWIFYDQNGKLFSEEVY
jgi:antitoxin component YwqK of YwqJK toxin-antitoxin module